jgi:aminopeptidase
MPDPRVEKLAGVLVNYSNQIRPGDRVLLQGSTLAEPLLKAVYTATLEAGGHPLLWTQLPGISEILLRHGSETQLDHIPEPIQLAFETYDAGISIWGNENTKALTSIDPARMARYNQAQGKLLMKMIERIGTKAFRWVGTQFPTHASAQDADLSLTEYEEFVYQACLPDFEDPIGYWGRFSVCQVRVVASGTDLQLEFTGRQFENCDGHENMPDGEVCASPVEDSVNGHVTFTYPANYQGREIEGIQLWFEQGRVVRAAADKGEEFLQCVLDVDPGARYVGEFAIGTNRGITRFTRNTLFDEKISGTFHMALGASLPETGGKNVSAIHWDIVCDLRDGGQIWIDDQLCYQNGEFLIEM